MKGAALRGKGAAGRGAPERDVFGLLAELATPEQLLAASKATYAAGYRQLDAFSPAPIEGLAAAIGHPGRGRLAKTVLAGGLAGAAGGFLLQYWVAAVAYPLNVGGRPPGGWQSFIPVTFELTVLAATLAAVLGMLAWNRLPMPYHPVFNVERFKLASSDRVFLGVGSADPLFDLQATRDFLEGRDGVVGVYEVDY
jgi:hypothetical protein